MNQQHILVVDDHQDIRELLATYLSQHGFDVSCAENGEQMRNLVANQHYDLIVLDIMMPGEDGLSLCRHIRDIEGPPVVMLTAMSEEADLVVGLEMGADDYVTKPFAPRVLLARIKSVLRRGQSLTGGRAVLQNKHWYFAPWTLDVHQRHLISNTGVVLALSTAEFRLLTVFLQHPRQVLSRDQLLTLTKGREADPFDRSIDNQVSRLRKKVEINPQQPLLIKTVWGGGYMLTAEVTMTSGPDS